MGIKDLSKFIREKTNAYEEVHLSKFFGKKVAVDISVFLYKTIRSVGEDQWMMPMIVLLRCLKKYGIKIVCVFDGENAPIEKLKERDERKKSSNKVKEKTEGIRKLIVEVKKLIPTDGSKSKEVPLDLRIAIKKACSQQRDSGKFDAIDYREVHSCLRALTMTEKKFAKQCIPITRQHSAIVKEIVAHLGMAVMQADGEAETMCAYMCVKGLVDAVLTEDSDVLPYGTPIFLSKIDTRKDTVMMIKHDNLLEQIGLSFDQFRDFCIMCSCDYNDRIKLPLKSGKTKQTGIGPKKAYDLLIKHGDIDNIGYMTDLDLEPLNHIRCRVLFTIPSFYDGLTLPYNKPANLAEVEKFLKKYNCIFMFESLKQMWSPREIQFLESDEEESDNSSDCESPILKSIVNDEEISKKEISYEIYTDGSCKPNPGAGGWGCLIESTNKKESFTKILKGGKNNTTNNEMELTSIYRALLYVDKISGENNGGVSVKIYTDSEYCKNCITVWSKTWKKNNWKTANGTPVKNKEIIEKIDLLSEKYNVCYEWVKAHASNEKNNTVDRIAQEEADKIKNEK